MIVTSPKWKNAIKAQFRYPGRLKATVTVVPPGLRENAVITANSEETIAPIQNALDGRDDYITPVATLESNRWKGDGTMYLASVDPSLNKDIGWWGKDVDKYPYTINVRFDKAYDIAGIHGLWDTETNSWPTSLGIIAYGAGDSIIYSKVVTSIDSQEYYIQMDIEGIVRFELVINSWSQPMWRPRVTELIFGFYLSLDDMRIVKSMENFQCTVESASLPVSTYSLQLKNYDNLFDPTLKVGPTKYLAQRQSVEWKWGFEVDRDNVEWMPSQTAFIDSINVPANKPELNISFTSRLAFLTEVYRGGLYVEAARTYYEIAEEVLDAANIIKTFLNEEPWILPDSLKDYKTNAPVPVASVNVILQLVANASGHTLSIDAVTGYIDFINGVTDTDVTVTRDQILGEPEIAIEKPLRSVKIGVYQYIKDTAEAVIYRAELKFTGLQILSVEYTGDSIFVDPAVEITGGAIIEQQLGSYGATLKVMGAGDVLITIMGKALKGNVTFIEYYKDISMVSGLDIEIDNELITNTDAAKHLAEIIVSRYKKRQLYKVPYLVYPEVEVMDKIHLNSTYNDSPGIVLEQSITYNGGWTGYCQILSEEVES